MVYSFLQGFNNLNSWVCNLHIGGNHDSLVLGNDFYLHLMNEYQLNVYFPKAFDLIRNLYYVLDPYDKLADFTKSEKRYGLVVWWSAHWCQGAIISKSPYPIETWHCSIKYFSCYFLLNFVLEEASRWSYLSKALIYYAKRPLLDPTKTVDLVIWVW